MREVVFYAFKVKIQAFGFNSLSYNCLELIVTICFFINTYTFEYVWSILLIIASRGGLVVVDTALLYKGRVVVPATGISVTLANLCCVHQDQTWVARVEQ